MPPEILLPIRIAALLAAAIINMRNVSQPDDAAATIADAKRFEEYLKADLPAPSA